MDMFAFVLQVRMKASQKITTGTFVSASGCCMSEGSEIISCGAVFIFSVSLSPNLEGTGQYLDPVHR